MSSLVQKIHKTNKTSRNVFDLSNSVNCVTCPGQLLPVRTDEVLPNDEFRFSQSAFARTLQMIVPSFARVKAHVDTFFVPYRLLGTDFQSIIVGDNRGVLANYSSGAFSNANKSLPTVTLGVLHSVISNTSYDDAAGYRCATTSPILMNALGYGNVGADVNAIAPTTNTNPLSDGEIGSSAKYSSLGSTATQNNMKMNILPLLAYQKIYQDFYRNKLWELENKLSYFITPSEDGKEFTIGEILSRGIIEMRYHDFDKDRFVGMIPDENEILSDGVSAYAQDIVTGISLGVDSLSSLGGNQIPTSKTGVPGTNNNVSNLSVQAVNANSYVASTSAGSPTTSVNYIVRSSMGNANLSPIVARLSALSFRRLEAFQKFAEITLMNKSDYKHQVKAHFGFDVPNLNSDYCQFVGGFDIPLNVSDVENNTSTGDGELGYLAGKGVLSGNSKEFRFHASEHGLLMSILYIVPYVDYINYNVDRSVLRFNRYDFAVPEFDSLGFEPVRICDLVNPANAPFETADTNINHDVYKVIGFLPRYWSYKTKIDANFAPAFGSAGVTNTLNYNSYIVNFPYERFVINLKAGTLYKAFKCVPWILDSIFPVQLAARTAVLSSAYVQYMPFIFTFRFNVSVMRSLSVDGLPY